MIAALVESKDVLFFFWIMNSVPRCTPHHSNVLLKNLNAGPLSFCLVNILLKLLKLFVCPVDKMCKHF